MRFDIMTLFPEAVDAMMQSSILGRAQKKGLIEIHTHQIRDYTTNKQNQVDDYPYGGGRGAVMQCDPLYRCWAAICDELGAPAHTIYLSPCGAVFQQEKAKQLRRDYDALILVCGHYEGVDQRFLDECVDEEISVGDFVLTGGELPAMCVVDAVSRLVPGVLGDEVCFTDESHWDGLLHESELMIAREINRHMPNVEMFRMLGSGTESVMAAMRIARIATGKKRVIKIGGAYHGWSDQVVYGLKIPGSRALLESHGIPGGCYEATDEVRPNDLEMLEEMLKRNRLLGGTAAVLVEPVGPESGTRPVAHDYNAGVRALCDKYGALMVFDEVVTGFRVALSGAQGYFGVVPDLTVFGKIVAGGYPAAGGVGGKKEYAQLMAAGLATGKHRAYVGGTLAANPLSCLAGYTAIREIERTNACEIAGRMGDRLCDGLKGLLAQYGLPFVAYNQGSIVHLECTGAMSFDFSSMSFAKSAMGLLKHKDMMYVRKDSMERMGAAYMANGIVTLAGSRLYTSMADTPEIIDDALNRFEEVFKHVQKTNKGML